MEVVSEVASEMASEVVSEEGLQYRYEGHRMFYHKLF